MGATETASFHKGISGFRLVTLGDMGHCRNWEAPDVIAEEAIRLAG